jgi:small subunit ribosomal protein S5
VSVEVGEKQSWTPRTKLGMLVQSGKITSLSTIFEQGYRIREPEIVRTLLPDLKSEVISAGIVQKQTDAGEITRFVAIVAVGSPGWFGVGRGKAMQMRSAIDKATNAALLNIIPVKLGCGSWECRCSRAHSVPYKIMGKAGSVTVEIIPGPRGLGLVAGETVRKLLSLAGVVDAWTKTFGSTNTPSSITNAVYEAFKNMHKLNLITR